MRAPAMMLLLLLVAATASASDIPIGRAEYGPDNPFTSTAAAAAMGGTWLTAWIDHQQRLLAARVGADGRLLDVPSLLLATGYFYTDNVDMVAIGDHWLVFARQAAWTVHADGSADGPTPLPGSERISAAASNGMRVAHASGRTLRILDGGLVTLITKPFPPNVLRIGLSDDGSGVALTGDGELLAFDATGAVSLRRSVSRGAIEFATMARDGDRFLLAWPSRDAGIVATVADRGGHEVSAPRTIAATEFVFESPVAAVSNGHGWTLAYTTSHGSDRSIQAVDIGLDGATDGAPLTLFSMTQASWLRSFEVPALASNGSRLLLLHRDYTEAPISATLFSTLPSFQATRQFLPAVSTSALRQYGLSMAAADGEHFVAVWLERVQPETFWNYERGPQDRSAVMRVCLSAVSSAGASSPLELQRAPIDSDAYESGTATAAAASSDGVVAVAWQLGGVLSAAIAGPDGGLVTVPVPISYRVAQSIGVAWNGAAFQLVWTDAYGQAWGSLLSRRGVATAPVALFPDVPYPLPLTRGLSIGCGGVDCVAAWVAGSYPDGIPEPLPSSYDLAIVRFDARGQVLSRYRRSGILETRPLVYVDGEGEASLVLTHDAGYVVGTRLAREGTPLDATSSATGKLLGSFSYRTFTYAIAAVASAYFALEDSYDPYSNVRPPQRLLESGVVFQPHTERLGVADRGVFGVANDRNEYDIDVFTVVRNDAGTFAVISYGQDDARYTARRFFLRQVAEPPHRHAVKR